MFKGIGLHIENMLAILDPIFNTIGGAYMTKPNEHKNLHFDNE